MSWFEIEDLLQCGHRGLGADGVQELGARLDAHRREVATGGDADAGHRMLEAEAVLAPAVWGDAEDELAELEGRRALRLAGPRSTILEAIQKSFGYFRPSGHVEGVDSGRQLAQRPNWRICD
ncbi:MAG: hypothetical protein ACLPVF_04600 [Acidimicrobiales bacterium]